MCDITTCEMTLRIAAILAKFAQNPDVRIDSATTLHDLDIDCLDQPMIVLDIEDAVDVDLGNHTHMADTTTVRDLVEAAVTAKASALQWRQLRASTPRIKRSWLSTEAEHRN